MKRTKVVILFGGPSSEHEVSINSAKNVISSIDTEIYEPIEVYISKEGLFSLNNKSLDIENAVEEMKCEEVEVILPILHGAFGEDGKLQEVLEKERIKFVGSGSKASALAMNKNEANHLFEENGLAVPRSQIVEANDDIHLSFPIIFKPIDEGSSVGLSKINSHEEYKDLSKDIFRKHSKMLAQEYIAGQEFTCGVIEIEASNKVLPVTEIILNKSGVFDYDAKYTAGACLEVTPANIDSKITEKIQATALKCHEMLGCKSISRTDMILSNDGSLYVLETNTLPGMTKTSFIPAQAKQAGISMKDLVTSLIKSAHF